MAKRVRLHNPANPVETLAIINHGGRMVRKKTPNKPRHHHKKPVAKNTRRRSRRANPSLKGIASGALFAFGGAAVTNIIGGFLPIQLSGWPAIGLRFIIAYVAGYAAEKFTSPQNAQLVAIGGASSAAGDAVNLLLGAVHPLTQQTGNLQLPGNAPAAANGGAGDIVRFPYRGVGDIVNTPDFMKRAA